MSAGILSSLKKAITSVTSVSFSNGPLRKTRRGPLAANAGAQLMKAESVSDAKAYNTTYIKGEISVSDERTEV